MPRCVFIVFIAFSPDTQPTLAVQPDQECLAAQVFLRQQAPETAVIAVVTVVAHHQVLAGRHGPLALATRIVGLQHGVGAARQVLDQQVGALALALVAGIDALVVVLQRLAVEDHAVALEDDGVTRHADHALDEVLALGRVVVAVAGEVEHHHVATRRLAERHDLG
ncbi:hypothetical protein G6F22_018044 [Rhizopus arrhizus]|nr:hypothetical protein G6F22_018044 [Rhizopus arrhizus]